MTERIVRGKVTDYGFAYNAGEVLICPAGESSFARPMSRLPMRGTTTTYSEPGLVTTSAEITEATYQGVLLDEEHRRIALVPPTRRRPTSSR